LDPSDLDNVIQILYDNDDHITRSFVYAHYHGSGAGAENAIYESFKYWVNNPFDYGHALTVTNSSFDTPVTIYIDINVFMKQFYQSLEDIAFDGWADFMDVDNIEQPHYGWKGWDEAAAVYDFHVMLDIN